MLPEPLQKFKEEAEKILSEFEKLRGNAVFPLLYSWNRLIAKPDVDEVYECLLQIGSQPKLDVIIFSRGGDPDQAYVIGNLLQHFISEKLTIIVPRFAKSAATLIVCAGDEVAMGPASELGPIDLIIEKVINGKRYHISVISIMELTNMIKSGCFGDMALKVMELVDKRLPLLEFGDYGRLTEHITHLAEGLLIRRMWKDSPERAKKVAKELCEEYKSHNAAIVSSDLEGKLKTVKLEEQAWKLLWNLHKLWVDNVIEYENSFPEGARYGSINFKLGKGLVFCTQLIEKG
jgi:hypothetical protein